MLKSIPVLVLSAFACTGVALPLTAQELITNGSFETGSLAPDWLVFNNSANATVSITSDAASGSSAAVLTNNQPAVGLGLKQERFGQGVVAQGDQVVVSFDAKGSATDGGVQFAQFFFETANAGSSNGAGFLEPFAVSQAYQTYSYTRTLDSDVSGGLSILFSAITGGAPTSTSQLFVDNVSVVRVVPEPASLAVLALGGIALLARRQRAA